MIKCPFHKKKSPFVVRTARTSRYKQVHHIHKELSTTAVVKSGVKNPTCTHRNKVQLF